jgi:hypothetical protein
MDVVNRKGISGQGKLHLKPGEPDALKGACPVCAVRRVVISLPEAGGMREEIPGLLAYPEAKAEGDQACQASGASSKAL